MPLGGATLPLQQKSDHAEGPRLGGEREDRSTRIGQGGAGVRESGRGPRIEPFVLSVHRGRDQVVSLEEPEVIVRQGNREIESARQLAKVKSGVPADKIVEVPSSLDRQDPFVLGRHAPLNAAT